MISLTLEESPLLGSAGEKEEIGDTSFRLYVPSEDVPQDCVSMILHLSGGEVKAGYRGQWHMCKREASNYKTE